MADLLRNRHAGERCVLVCNGPSLNKMDLSFLRHEITVGLNKIFLGFKKFGFYPKYYVCVNEKVLRQSEEQIKALNCIKFLSNRCSSLFREGALTHILNTASPPARFCTDITQGLEEGWTVTYAALQILYFLGFKSVFIIGMDHNFVYDGHPNESHTMIGEDPNHFVPGYFGHGQDWDNPDLQHSEESYTIAKKIYERDGRKIWDATVDGHCTIFDKCDYSEIFLNAR